MSRLFTPPPVDPATLPPRQKAVYELLQRDRDGVSAGQAGIAAHRATGCNHCQKSACHFVVQDGRAVLQSLRAKGLAVERRKLRLWFATSSSQLGYNDPLPY